MTLHVVERRIENALAVTAVVVIVLGVMVILAEL